MGSETVCAGIELLPIVYEEVRDNVTSSQRRVKKRKEDRGQEDQFKIGDNVLMKNIRGQQRKGGKLERDMLGPYKIMDLNNKVTHLRPLHGTSTIIANIDHLVHYIEPEERVPAKLKRGKSLSSGLRQQPITHWHPIKSHCFMHQQP